MRIAFTLATVVATVLAAGQAAAQPAADAVKGFSIILLEGSLQPGTGSDLPASAQAAIADLKDFLPFKSYRLLDASWMLGATDVKSRLRGGDRDYDVAVAATPQPGAKALTIKFVLRDAASQDLTPFSPPPGSAGTAEFRRGQLDGTQARLRAEYEQLQALREKYSDDHPSIKSANESIARLRDRMKMLEKLQMDSLGTPAPGTLAPPGAFSPYGTAVAAGGTLIDTSFSARIGETVVVGTSRVNGERALIALMTAVPR